MVALRQLIWVRSAVICMALVWGACIDASIVSCFVVLEHWIRGKVLNLSASTDCSAVVSSLPRCWST
jgi:hypothetical protein